MEASRHKVKKKKKRRVNNVLVFDYWNGGLCRSTTNSVGVFHSCVAMVRLESGYPATLAEEASLQKQQQKKDEVLRGTHAEEDD